MKNINYRACRQWMLGIALMSALVLTGCADSFVQDVPEPEAAAPAASKLRNAHLLDQAAVHAAGKDSTGGNAYGLVVALSNGNLDKQAILERYRIMERYAEFRIMERYEYDTAFDGLALEVDEEILDDLVMDMSADPDVAWIEPDFHVGAIEKQDEDTQAASTEVLPWSLEHLGLRLGETRDASGAIIVILDTGVSSSDVNVGYSFDVVQRVEAVSADEDGHGTHIAGIAAGIDNTFGIVGVAPGATVVNAKVTDAEGNTESSTVMYAVEQITEFKKANPWYPMVVNISLGSDVGTTAYTALDEAIQRSIEAGVVYVIAAGNEGMDASTFSPAHVTEAITVGAHGADNQFAGFSNYGPVVDLLAPGVKVPSLCSSLIGTTADLAIMSGTSMAAPHVTGAVALYLTKNPSATPAQVRNALVNTSRAGVWKTPAGTTNRSLYLGRDGGLLGALYGTVTGLTGL